MHGRHANRCVLPSVCALRRCKQASSYRYYIALRLGPVVSRLTQATTCQCRDMVKMRSGDPRLPGSTVGHNRHTNRQACILSGLKDTARIQNGVPTPPSGGTETQQECRQTCPGMPLGGAGTWLVWKQVNTYCHVVALVHGSSCNSLW